MQSPDAVLVKRPKATIGRLAGRRPTVRWWHEGTDRRTLRRVAAGLCLVLALYCLIVATATLQAQTVPGEPDARKLPESLRSWLLLVTPLLFVVLVVVLEPVARRGRRVSRRWTGRAGRGQLTPRAVARP